MDDCPLHLDGPCDGVEGDDEHGQYDPCDPQEVYRRLAIEDGD